MTSDYIPLYKTIVLTLLRRAEVVPTRAQVMDFVLEAGYTDYMTLQEVMSELSSQALIREETEGNRTFLHLTEEGRETIDALQESLRADIIRQVDDYLTKNRLQMRDEASLRGDYTRRADSTYEVRCDAYENGRRLYGIVVEAPTEEAALNMIDRWKKQSAEIYADLVRRLGGE